MYSDSFVTPHKKLLAFKIGAALLVAVYLINCCSPIRLHVDMLRYFAIKDCIELGCDPSSEAAKDYLPFGYTALLLVLSKIGLLKSWSLVLINCIYLLGGVYLIKKIFSHQVNFGQLLVFVLLSWTTIKFVTHPLSEMQYIFFSALALYFFYRFSTTDRVLYLLVAFIAAALAFLTRSAGIALAAALGTGMIWHYRKGLLILLRKYKVVAVLLLLGVIGVVVFSKQLGLNHYTGVFTKQFDEGVSFPLILKWHFTEWTELGLNISSAKVLQYIPASLSQVFFVSAGILFFGIFVYLVYIRRNKISFVIKSYIFFYSLLMFTWPFYDPRFWVPLIPIIVAVCLQAYHQRGASKLMKKVFVLYAIFYALAGIASISFITSTSLNKEKFATTQANGAYRNEYETVFFGKPVTDTAMKIDKAALDVIKRYNR